MTRTDAKGRATFDRLATGRYRVRTIAARRCNGRTLGLAQVVPISGRGTFAVRIVADGTARFRLTSPFGPMPGALVTVSPNPFESPLLPGLRTTPETAMQQRILSGSFSSETSCSGYTDRNGRLTLANFPPGPARVSVQFPNSRYVRSLTIPEEPGEMTLPIPDGLLPVYVTSALGKPVNGADLTWIGSGGRVEAQTLPTGHALLESVGAAPGTLVVTAARHERVEAKLPEPPGTIHEVALTPTPATSLQARVITESGEPAPRAIVELTPENGLETGHIAVADAQGVVTFSDVPAGALQLTARADGFATAAASIADDARTGSVLMLSRGFRAILSVELPPEGGAQLIRVVDETGRAIEDLLDVASDRSVAAPGRLSLGPLAPGTYVIELRGVRERRQVRITIASEDVFVSIR